MKSITDQLLDQQSTEIRTLRYQKKLLGKQLGRAGATIYALRNENAALREAVKFDPGDRARLLAQLREGNIENRLLREKLAAKEEKA